MKTRKKQQGVVLFLSLIILLLMTLIGVALATNSTQSLRMAGSGSDRVSALARANGASQRLIITQPAQGLANLTAEITNVDQKLDASSRVIPMQTDDLDCQRSSQANANNIISCRRIEIRTQVKFGQHDLGRLTTVTGVEQEVLSGS
ncbi:PilX N-terminal domain-containing pilus assembly protein [Shewanella sp. NIFS-20-20]|uniref:PilX N-terminal domain-containing pilus assembly protein n=1 Tax=Shewanella sp. NIFS-20-20 TaxID=2853806 RepID=UPI001C44326E|nr:PilX N-terminal domain-containing pilus assembly protein [Shewanella sp. NIFS-20-20]MBV7314180.1 pilus assembly protein PilX [Shewanella sp. NIFS-20-20]